MATKKEPRKSHLRAVRTPEKRKKFLDVLAQSCNVSKACKLSRVPRACAYQWRDEDPKFKADWEKAVEVGADVLEEEAIRRARDGVKKPVFQGGRLVGHVQEYSDTLLIFLLKGAKKEKYAERTNHNHAGKVTLEQLVCGDEE